MSERCASGPFTLEGQLPGCPPRLSAALAAALDGVLGLAELQRLYHRAQARDGSFVDRALGVLDIAVDVSWDPAAVPPSGPLLVVANHPFGVADGLVALSALHRMRRDVKVLANGLLRTVPDMRDVLIPVNPYVKGGSPANAVGLRAALAWLARGGCLLAFPSGEIARRLVDEDVAIDAAWHPHIAALAVHAGATVLPMFIAGANSRVFRTAAGLHWMLGTPLLPRELLRRRGTRIRVVVGEPVGPAELSSLPTADRAPYLKTRTCLLAQRLPRQAPPPPVEARHETPIVAPVEAALVADDVAGLSPERLMAITGDLCVYCAPAGELPHVLQEIGRLREETFRAVGEGTGRATDLDRFDQTYLHVFAWDAKRRVVVGAYRLGATDEIVAREGPSGLYTNSLFRYDQRLLDEIGPALELGRSFVRREYQRAFAPLLALWKGIGCFAARHPRYRRLMGAVSISNRYESMSRQLLVRFLSTAAAHPAAARLVRARRPLSVRPADERLLKGACVTTLEGVSSLVRAIERDGKPIPVLLRQYLNLNARLLAFSVDPDFGDAVDGLMLADLTEVPAPMLDRLMGPEAAARFVACHLGSNAIATSQAPRSRRRGWRRLAHA